MSELSYGTHEQKMSSEQRLLIDTAHGLLTLPNTVTDGPYYSYRPTTRKEKIQRALGKLTRKQVTKDVHADDFFEVAVTQKATNTIGIRGLLEKDGPAGWGGGVYLKQVLVRNLETGEIEESLSLYATRIVDNNHAFTQLSALKEDVLWSVDLTIPIDSNGEITRLQSELNKAIQQYNNITTLILSRTSAVDGHQLWFTNVVTMHNLLLRDLATAKSLLIY